MPESIEITIVEWGEWECPVCGSTQEDPETITITACANGHACILGPVEYSIPSLGHAKNHRWAEREL